MTRSTDRDRLLSDVPKTGLEKLQNLSEEQWKQLLNSYGPQKQEDYNGFVEILISPNKELITPTINPHLKPRLLALIVKCSDPTIRQNALWQALLPKTFLGKIFWEQRGLTGYSTKSGTLEDVVRKLNAETEKHGVLLNDSTRAALPENFDGLREVFANSANKFLNIYIKDALYYLFEQEISLTASYVQWYVKAHASDDMFRKEHIWCVNRAAIIGEEKEYAIIHNAASRYYDVLPSAFTETHFLKGHREPLLNSRSLFTATMFRIKENRIAITPFFAKLWEIKAIHLLWLIFKKPCRSFMIN